jgi:hypothetical protein
MQSSMEYSDNIILHFTNLGTGPATRINAEYRIPDSSQNGKKEFAFILPQDTKQWSLPVPQPKRGATLEIRLQYEYWDILDVRYSQEKVMLITPEDNVRQGDES